MPSVEERLQIVEDRLAIYNLLAAHPLSADTGLETFINNVYTSDALIDRGTGLSSPQGRDKILAVMQSDVHKADIFDGGLGHFGNLPLVELRGDHAFATSYILLIMPDEKGEVRQTANHGPSKGYRIHRHVANRWTLVRTEQGWRVKARRLVFHDGSEQDRDLCREARSLYE